MRLHPVCTTSFIDDGVLPAVARGAARAGRPLTAVAFYLSTPSYRRTFERHGWGDVARRSIQLLASPPGHASGGSCATGAIGVPA